MFRRTAPAILALLAFTTRADVILQLTDRRGNAVPDAVVYLENLAGTTADDRPAGAIIDQRNEQFVPQVTVVQAGATVAFPNSDNIGHHVYSFAQPNAFELPLYKGELRPEILFSHPGIVTLGCNIHDSMLGYVIVVDTPYFGTTGPDGRVRLDALPPGRYSVEAWSLAANPLAPEELGAIEVVGGATAADRFSLRLDARVAGRSEPHGDALSWDDY